MTQEQNAATEAAKLAAETRERKAHMEKQASVQPQNSTPIDRPLTPPTE